MKRILIILVFLTFSLLTFPQVHSKIDSLQSAFNNEKDPRIQGTLVDMLLHEYLAISQDSANMYIDRIFKINKDNKKGQSMMYYYMGNAYSDFKLYPNALSAFRNQLTLLREMKSKGEEGRCLLSIGIIYFNQSFYPEALDSYLESLNIFQEINDSSGIGQSLINIASIYSLTGNSSKALEYQLKVLHYANNIGAEKITSMFGKYAFASLYFQIANTYLLEEDFSASMEYFYKSERIYDSLNYTEMLGSCYNNIGEVYFQKEDYQNALDYYNKALQIGREMDYKNDISLYLNNIGATYNKLKQFNRALGFCSEGYKLASRENIREMIKTSAENLTNSYEGLGDFKQAFKYYKIFNAYTDSLSLDETKQRIQQLEMKNEFSLRLKEQDVIQKEKDDKINAELRQQKLIRNFAVGGIILLIFGLFFAIRSYNIKRKSNHLLALQKEEIEDKNIVLNQQKAHIEHIHHEVTQSIDYAKRIQSSIFPDDSLLTKYLSGHFIMLHPKDRVSGDFYWWAKTEDSMVIAVADCTGHGVPGAFMSMLGVSFLREIVTKEYISQPDVILRKLRKEIMNTLKQEGKEGEQKDGMDIALISINLSTNVLQFAGANNPIYIIRDGVLNEIKADKMPISIYEKMDKFINNEFQLKKEDSLYLFSDGFADQFGGEFCKKFKYKPFQQLLISISDKPMEEQKEKISSTFMDWKKTTEQTDDVLVIGLKI